MGDHSTPTFTTLPDLASVRVGLPLAHMPKVGSVSHVRLNIYPDGGVSRLRNHGTLARA